MNGLDWLFALWLLVVGLCLGSFLNVVIARLPEGQSVVRPGSRCPKCGHPLRWYENVPVLSFLFLRGKCSACKAPISWRYPAVELLVGLLFLAALRQFGWTMDLVLALMLIILLVPLTFIDLQHWLLPFELTIPGIAVGVALSAALGMERLRDSVIGAVAGFLVFWGLEWVGQRIFKKEALGGGDKFLLAMIGAFLTWRALLGVIFLASLQGAIVGLVLLAARGRAGPAAPEPTEEDDWQPGASNIPFGPWLSLAALELLFFSGSLGRLAPEVIALMFPGRA
jgi:leader peptidase (prepilin peptidase)/N-methyltransferase